MFKLAMNKKFRLKLALLFLLVPIAGWSMNDSGYRNKTAIREDSLAKKKAAEKVYTIAETNHVGMNYTENLLDMRNNITSYSHLGAESNKEDAWHLHFPDDAARFLEGIAWEADFSPVVRLELGRRVSKGLMATHVPGTRGYYHFRHRIGGKSELVFEDGKPEAKGRLILSTWGDAISGEVTVGFRAQKEGKWHEIEQFGFKDTPDHGGNPGVARSPINWNKSPYAFERKFSKNDLNVNFTGTYWLSDEDKPLAYEFKSEEADRVEIVIGDPREAMPLLASGNGKLPGIITLPDRKTTFQSDKTGDKEFLNPDFNYLVLSKNNAWAAQGYATALLVIWEGKPEKVTAIANNGYGEIRVSYNKKDKQAGGRVWLYPFPVLNQKDNEYVFRNAENFLSKGKLLTNSFPPQQMFNALPAGLAAGAYMMAKYKDPLEPTIRAHAIKAVDEVMEGELDGKKLARVFFEVRAAAWMVKAGKELGDQAMVDKYTAFLDIVTKRMLSSDVGYDGKGWPSGWDHFNAAKSVWLAFDATGKKEYEEAFQRALTVYTIDSQGIYRYGKKMEAPGGFETYFGSLPMGVWGLAGKLEWADQLLRLQVPAEPNSKATVKDMWHYGGNGPWAQDDANPEYVGLSLKGLNIPQDKKYVVPVGAFPEYDASGKVTISKKAIVENPFFLPGKGTVKIVAKNEFKMPAVDRQDLVPGGKAEQQVLQKVVGKVVGKVREVTSKDGPLVYAFDIAKASGAALDLDIRGEGFQVEVSPDGTRWYPRMDTWSQQYTTQSIDCSFLTGNRDELLKMLVVDPGNDQHYLQSAGSSQVAATNTRLVTKGSGFVYKLDLRQVTEAQIELFVAGNYKVECSSDGKNWKKEIDAKGIKADRDDIWIRMVDVTDYLKKGSDLYVRFSADSDSSAGEPSAFLKRLTVYGVMKSTKLFVRLSNVESPLPKSFSLAGVRLRKWTVAE